MELSAMNRREFMRVGTSAAVLGAAGAAVAAGKPSAPVILAQAALDNAASSGETVSFVSIGTGVRGCDLLHAARQAKLGICVGAADLYDGRHQAAIESWGAEIPTSRDYRALLDRKDVKAVVVAVPDHLHRAVVLDCIAAGKDVYCEKPMSHTVADGLTMVQAVQANKRIFQAGSQRVSSVLYKKAAEIFASGRLGEVHLIEGHSDRNSPSGAWVYPIPPDASPKTIDWDAFLRDAPARPFDAARFFRWRCFADYGEGAAGDLYVHLLSGIQAITGINAAPSRAYSTGSLTHYTDGRDFPDLLATMYDYPGVTVNLHCNQNNEAGEPITFYGSKATMVVNGNNLTVTPQDTNPRPEGYSINGWPANLRKQYLDEWKAAHPESPAKLAETESYMTPPGYNDTADHLLTFFKAVNSRQPVAEDEVFGNHAAIACHMANHSYFHREIALWDEGAKAIRS
jgi:predicted dehydrogenase